MSGVGSPDHYVPAGSAWSICGRSGVRFKTDAQERTDCMQCRAAIRKQRHQQEQLEAEYTKRSAQRFEDITHSAFAELEQE